MEKVEKKPTAIDLFCGAGGLTLGLKKANFEVVAGLERFDNVARTYHRNHPEVHLIVDDVRNVSGQRILNEVKLKEIDLIAGCPPCQGFSKLTDKYRREDSRNDLVFEMAKIIKDIQPKMVMMENVPGLMKGRGKLIFNDFTTMLDDMGYVVRADVLQMADYGIPQSRKRLVLLAGKGFEIPLPKPTHAYKADPKKGLKQWLTMNDIRDQLDSLGDPIRFSQAQSWGGAQKFNWHVVRDLEEISLKRLKALKEGEGRLSLPPELRPKCHKGGDEGFENVYGRLSWSQTPPTMTGGCTTPCKGRFGHPNPDQIRTISVREAALIQTFPKKYRFELDKIEDVCTMIGNALPPKFAQIAAKTCLDAQKRHKEASTSGAITNL